MIPVEKVADLTLREAGGDERSDHISAASSLVRVGETLYVVADDALQLGIFPAFGRAEGTLVPLLEGELPEDAQARKRDKADLESLVALPPAEGWLHGALLALGSGSGSKRNSGALLMLEEDGAPSSGTTEVDLHPLYDHLRESIPELNIEGAAVVDDSVWLLQRGDNADGRNAVIRLDLKKAEMGLRDGRLAEDALIGTDFYDLGTLVGIKLAFSDASPLEDGRVAMSASAEDSREGSDGGYVGSALGVMGADGAIEFLEPVDLDVKLEGMTARIDGDEIVFMLVTDADDPSIPSPLLEARLDTSSLSS